LQKREGLSDSVKNVLPIHYAGLGQTTFQRKGTIVGVRSGMMRGYNTVSGGQRRRTCWGGLVRCSWEPRCQTPST
jgi:hypothetical protein